MPFYPALFPAATISQRYNTLDFPVGKLCANRDAARSYWMTQRKNARYGINIFRSERYYTDEVAEHLEDIVNMSKNLMQEIAVIDYSQVP